MLLCTARAWSQILCTVRMSEMLNVFPMYMEVGPAIERQTTRMRSPICSEKRLMITLHWLSTSLRYKDLKPVHQLREAMVRPGQPRCTRCLWCLCLLLGDTSRLLTAAISRVIIKPIKQSCSSHFLRSACLQCIDTSTS